MVSSQSDLAVGAGVSDLVQIGDAEWNTTVEPGDEAEEEPGAKHGAADDPLESTRSLLGSWKRRESVN